MSNFSNILFATACENDPVQCRETNKAKLILCSFGKHTVKGTTIRYEDRAEHADRYVGGAWTTRKRIFRIFDSINKRFFVYQVLGPNI